MKRTSLGEWIVRFIFCLAVIVAFKTFENLNFIIDFLSSIFKMLTPFIIGGAIAFFLYPICRKMEALLFKTNKIFIKKHLRGLSTLVVYIIALLILIGALLLVIPMLYQSIYDFAKSIPNYLDKIKEIMVDHFSKTNNLDGTIEYVQGLFSFDRLLSGLSNLNINGYVGGIANVFVSILNVFIGIIISVYLILDRTSIKNKILRILNISIKTRASQRVQNIVTKISNVIYTFIFGQMLDALIIGTIIGILLTLFKVQNSIMLALIYFMFALIPYFGSIIGVLLITLLSFLSGNLEQTIVTGITALLMQQIDSNLINPKVVGHAVGIRPLYVILGITLFGGLLGFIGLFFGPPLMAILIELVNDIIKNKEEKLKNESSSKKKEKGILQQIKESVSSDNGDTF